jgi:uncharacterized membrane protein
MVTAALDDTRTRPEPGDGPVRFGAGKVYACLLVICGLMGATAAWSIVIDEFHLARNPNFTPGCSINPIISCGNIMKSDQAHVFGFPNPMIGMVAYPIVVAVGMSLLARARFPRWYWLTFLGGTFLGAAFVTWLQFESLYRIHSLCPWCMLAWLGTMAAFYYTLVHTIRIRAVHVGEGVRSLVLEFHWVGLVLWYGIVIMLILIRWWYYWKTVI